ncbi:hypothetical protein EON65_25280 [archaeon]|nr:MAG: hypothetical protein EON65_25280 [archaeon]
MTGFRWTGSSQAPSPYDQQPVSSTNSLPRPTISQDTLNSSPAVGNHNANSYCLGGVILDEGSMRDGGKNSKPATPTTEHPKTQLVLHKSPSFDSK